jgi:hypothetical protein
LAPSGFISYILSGAENEVTALIDVHTKVAPMENKVFKLFAQKTFPVGVEITAKFVRMAQLGLAGGQIRLVAGGSEPLPDGIEPYSGQWQRCAIEAVRSIYSTSPFKSKNIVTVIPSSDVFSKEIRKSLSGTGSAEIINTEAKKLLACGAEGALVKHIILNENKNSSDEKDILILATEKFKVERHLAIFEKAGLNVKAVTVWPIVLVNCCVNIFGRRKTDADTVVLLINATATDCNIVICRQRNILFARVIPFGVSALAEPDGAEKLVSEIEACIRYFQTTVRTADIERIILLANERADQRLNQCVLAVAKKHALPAHVGDVLAAVANPDAYRLGIDARGAKDDWTTTFGLSLSDYRNQEQ